LGEPGRILSSTHPDPEGTLLRGSSLELRRNAGVVIGLA
jgi:hypothetical protein